MDLKQAQALHFQATRGDAAKRAEGARALAAFVASGTRVAPQTLEVLSSACVEAAPHLVGPLIAFYLARAGTPPARLFLVSRRGRAELAMNERPAVRASIDAARALLSARPKRTSPSGLSSIDAWPAALHEAARFASDAARWLEAEGDFDGAAAACRLSLTLRPNDDLEALARVCFKQGRLDEAEALIKRYVRIQRAGRRSSCADEEDDPTIEAKKLLVAIASARRGRDRAPEPTTWAPGDTVTHSKFGVGTVVGREDARVRVRFADGERVLVANALRGKGPLPEST